MKIDHIFRNMNSFGGAEEHITCLAELQKAQGDDVSVCLIQSVLAENQYARRLKAAAVPIHQWPVWLSRFSGDWDTREEILRLSIIGLGPLITLIVLFYKIFSNRPQYRNRESVEGRVRSTLGRFLDPKRERQLFLLLLFWRYTYHKPDVLHLHSYGADLEFVLHWAQAHNLPALYQEHSTPDLTVRRWYKLPTHLNTARIIIAVSEASAKALRQLCRVTRPIQVIPPIVAVTIPKEELRKPPELNDGDFHILTIARLSIEKGLDCLIGAAQRVVEVKPHVKFIIYGEGYLRESLEVQIENANLQNRIRLAGSFTRNELPAIMSAADIFVLPSLTEGFPLSVIEAMAWGLPIVATAVGGIPEIIEEGITGLLCPPQDEDALARAIITLINNSVQFKMLGMAARRTYDNKFRPEHIVTQFADAYSRALHTN